MDYATSKVILTLILTLPLLAVVFYVFFHTSNEDKNATKVNPYRSEKKKQ